MFKIDKERVIVEDLNYPGYDDTADIEVINENFRKLKEKNESQDNAINGKEPKINKKSGFNLDKTDVPENNTNKLFTAKGALDLKNLISKNEYYINARDFGNSSTPIDILEFAMSNPTGFYCSTSSNNVFINLPPTIQGAFEMTVTSINKSATNTYRTVLIKDIRTNNYFVNTQTNWQAPWKWIGWTSIYSSTNKPTPNDIGAIPDNLLHKNNGTGDSWARSPIPRISASGVIEIGKYIDFHETDNDSSDYSYRIYINSGFMHVRKADGSDGVVYTSLNKPTPADINAYTKEECNNLFVNSSGDRINGNFTFDVGNGEKRIVSTVNMGYFMNQASIGFYDWANNRSVFAYNKDNSTITIDPAVYIRNTLQTNGLNVTRSNYPGIALVVASGTTPLTTTVIEKDNTSGSIYISHRDNEGNKNNQVYIGTTSNGQLLAESDAYKKSEVYNKNEVYQKSEIYTKNEANTKFVDSTGDTIHGRLDVDGVITSAGKRVLTVNTALSGTDSINATNGSTNAWNYPDDKKIRIVSGNNAMAMWVSESFNSRRAYIQSGHETYSYASSVGELNLNPFGGSVKANGQLLIKDGDMNQRALIWAGNSYTAEFTLPDGSTWLDFLYIGCLGNNQTGVLDCRFIHEMSVGQSVLIGYGQGDSRDMSATFTKLSSTKGRIEQGGSGGPSQDQVITIKYVFARRFKYSS